MTYLIWLHQFSTTSITFLVNRLLDPQRQWQYIHILADFFSLLCRLLFPLNGLHYNTFCVPTNFLFTFLGNHRGTSDMRQTIRLPGKDWLEDIELGEGFAADLDVLGLLLDHEIVLVFIDRAHLEVLVDGVDGLLGLSKI